MNIVKQLFFLSLIIMMVSCGDDEMEQKEETVIDKIEGVHNGEYRRIACSFLQTELFADAQSELNLVSTSDSTVSVKLTYTEDGADGLFDFSAKIVADSMLSSEEFEIEDVTYFANIFLKEDSKVSVLMSNGCSLGSSLVPTNIFTED